MKSASFLRSSRRGVVRVDRLQMKELRYVTMPRNFWSLVTFVGAKRACTASTFSGSGCMPLASYRQPKKFTAGAFTCVFCGLNTTPYLQATFMRFADGCHVLPQCDHVW